MEENLKIAIDNIREVIKNTSEYTTTMNYLKESCDNLVIVLKVVYKVEY